MKTFLSIVFLGLSLTAATGEAAACRLSGIRPLPVRSDYAAVALATVIDGDEHGADVRFGLTFDGRVAARTVRLDYSGQQRDGNLVITLCQALGPRVRAGDRVVVVTTMTGEGRQRAAGWTTLATAEREDDFFALYRAEPRSAVRRRLRERWREVNRHGGPIPLTDPSRWMAPFAGGLQFAAFGETTRARFSVGSDGSVVDCEVQRPGGPTPRDRRACQRLSRQRFLPPVFARERYGYYEVRWDQRADAPAP
jgi:hypothetical protein